MRSRRGMSLPSLVVFISLFRIPVLLSWVSISLQCNCNVCDNFPASLIPQPCFHMAVLRLVQRVLLHRFSICHTPYFRSIQSHRIRPTIMAGAMRVLIAGRGCKVYYTSDAVTETALMLMLLPAPRWPS